jgi:hypothetical protein
MWIGHDGCISRLEHGPHQVGKTLLGPNRGDHLRVGVEIDAKPASIPAGKRLSQIVDPTGGRVTMICRITRRFDQGLHRNIGGRKVGVAKPQVDHVDPGETCFGLAPVHLGEGIGR